MYILYIEIRVYLWYNVYNGIEGFINISQKGIIKRMSLSYEKLFLLMKEKGLTTYKIRKENIISQSALTALKNGKSVTTDTIEKLCKALNCQPGDIMSYVNEENFFED